MILTADFHLDDAPANAYRWDVFDRLREAMREERDPHIVMLGDITDRKDRHPAALVNRLVAELKGLEAERIEIIMGNHDQPLKGSPFWSFLNEIDERIAFIAEPESAGDLLFLPYAHDPGEAWADLNFAMYKVAFMHQTVTGVKADNGFELVNAKMPSFPKSLIVYSGDIHTPQIVGGVQYVGAPHPVKFGDDYACRMLVIDDRSYRVRKAIPLRPPMKAVLEMEEVVNFHCLGLRAGDQARIRYKLDIAEMDAWPSIKRAIMDQAAAEGVVLASVEAIVTMGQASKPETAPSAALTPEEELDAFCEAEGITGPLLSAARAILAEPS